MLLNIENVNDHWLPVLESTVNDINKFNYFRTSCIFIYDTHGNCSKCLGSKYLLCIFCSVCVCVCKLINELNVFSLFHKITKIQHLSIGSIPLTGYLLDLFH